VQREVEVGLQRRLRRELQVEPLIICVVQPAPAGTPAYKGRADTEPDTRPASRGGRDGGGRDGGVRRDVVRDSSGRAPLPQRQLATVGAPASASATSATEVAAVAAVPAPAVSVPVVKAAPVEEIEPEPAGRIRRRRSAAAE
jgi:ribonuclease J